VKQAILACQDSNRYYPPKLASRCNSLCFVSGIGYSGTGGCFVRKHKFQNGTKRRHGCRCRHFVGVLEWKSGF
jgi:hypothetical protein